MNKASATSAPASAQAPSPRRPHRLRRALAWLAAILCLVAALLATAAWTLLRTEWGARALWENANRFVPGELKGELQGGTLSDGLRLRNIAYSDDKKQIRIDSADAAWHFSWSPMKLSVRHLRLGTVDVTQRPSPPEPMTMPAEIRLPLQLELNDVTVRQVLLHQEGKDSSYTDIRLRASSDRVHHAMRVETATTPFGTVQAALRLTGTQPFPVDGTASLAARYGGQPVDVDTRVGGSLEALTVELAVAGSGLSGHAHIDATPFKAVPLQRAEVRIDGFDPRALNPAWPQARLDVHAALTPAGNTAGASGGASTMIVAGPVEILNAEPGRIDAGRVPLVSARAMVRLDAQKQELGQVQIRLPGEALLQGGGELRTDGNGAFALEASGLDLHALHGAFVPTGLAGPIKLRLAPDAQAVQFDLDGPKLSARASVELGQTAIALQSARLASGPAVLDISGSLARDERSAFSVAGSLRDFDPALFFTNVQPAQLDSKTRSRLAAIDARVNMRFEAQGALHPEASAKIRFDINDSRYAGLPMTGAGLIQFEGKRVLPSDARLSLAGNDISLKGSFGKPGDRLAFHADAPALARLGFGLSGLLRADGEIGGSIENPDVDARYRAENLAFGEHRLTLLSGSAQMRGMPATAPDARVGLDLTARDVRSGDIRLAHVKAEISGSYAQHAIRLDADGNLRGATLDLALAAQGSLQQQAQGLLWKGRLNTFENKGVPRLALASPLEASAGPGRLDLGNARLSFAGARIDLQELRYANGQLRSAGQVSALDIGRVLALQEQITGQKAPLDTDLVLDGSWNVSIAENADGFVRVERRGGDIRIPGPVAQNTLGLNALSLRADLQGKQVALEANASTRAIGSLAGQGRIGLQDQDGRLALGADAPVSARITASVPDLQKIASLAGPRIALNGQLALDLGINGSLADPIMSGTVNGDRLAVTLFEQGVRLNDGTARIVIDNNVIGLQRVVFHGGDGTLDITGSIPLRDEGRDLHATISADKLQLLASPSGRLTVSGQATTSRVGEQLLVAGKFNVDRALFSLPEKSAPKLDDDVVIVRGDQPAQAQRPAGVAKTSPYTPRIDISVGLGNNFRFAGAGADLRLAGTVRIVSEPAETPQAFGTVRIAEGTYEAFGAKLAVERGLINFQGPMTNPNLNILAMRREQQREVAAGVQVTGNVSQPRVQLVSEPNVPDEEKLSWLIFGRSGGGAAQGQAQSAAKGAAFGLLNKFGGQRLAKGFGLDELSIQSSEFGLAGGQQVVNLGKEISDRLFLGYEQSLSGAESVIKLSYELSRYWTVVLRGGTLAGLDLLYSRRFDVIGERPGAARRRE